MVNRYAAGTRFGRENVIHFRGRSFRNVGHMDIV